MATYNGNDMYLTIDGTDVSAYLVDAELDPTIEVEDVTAGSGATHMERNEGLNDYNFNFTMVYDSGQEATHLPLLQPGTKTIIFGIRGSTGGYPKHAGSFIITKAPLKTQVSKKLVAYNASAVGNGAPTTDMYAGGTF